MKKRFSTIIKSVGSAAGVNLLFALFLFFAHQNIIKDIASMCILAVSGVIFPFVYFSLKKGSKNPILYTVVCTLTYAILFICVLGFARVRFESSDQLELSLYALFPIGSYLGILSADVVYMIYNAVKRRTKATGEKASFYAAASRYAYIAISAGCVFCIYALCPSVRDIGALFALTFIPALFASLYFISMSNSNSPWRYLCCAVVSHIIFGMPILYDLYRKFYMHYAQNVRLDLQDMKIAVYLCVVCLLILAFMQTIFFKIKDKPDKTQC